MEYLKIILSFLYSYIGILTIGAVLLSLSMYKHRKKGFRLALWASFNVVWLTFALLILFHIK